jgi:uncharacterized protein (DUF2225 family)
VTAPIQRETLTSRNYEKCTTTTITVYLYYSSAEKQNQKFKTSLEETVSLSAKSRWIHMIEKKKKKKKKMMMMKELWAPQIDGESKRAYLYLPKHIHKLLTVRRDLIVFWEQEEKHPKGKKIIHKMGPFGDNTYLLSFFLFFSATLLF